VKRTEDDVQSSSTVDKMMPGDIFFSNYNLIHYFDLDFFEDGMP